MKRAGVQPITNTEASDADIRRWYDSVDIKCLVSYLNTIHGAGSGVVFDEMSVMCCHAELTREVAA